jgi:ribosome recycling factor
MPLLKEIATTDVEDVRIALSMYRQQMLEQLSKGIENPKLTLSHSTLKSSSN